MSDPHPETLARLPPDNLHAPIHKLPNEILLKFFTLAVASDPERLPFFITHVCRHWCAVAVGAPLLWVKPRTDNYDCVKLMLERSDPVDFDVALTSSMPIRTAQAIMQYVHRIRSLELYQGDDVASSSMPTDSDNNLVTHLTPFILGELTQPQPLPRLQALKCWSRWDDSGPLGMHRLLPRLQPMEQLRRLSLINISVDWSIFPLRNLVQLHFRNPCALTPISIQKFITILGQMPLLEILSLTPRFSRPDDLLSQPTLPVSAADTTWKQPKATALPLLYDLSLSQTRADYALHFLTHTVLPQLRHISLGVEIDERLDNAGFWDSVYPHLIRALTTTITGGNFDVFDTLGFYSGSVQIKTQCIADDGDSNASKQTQLADSGIDIHFGYRFWEETRVDGRLGMEVLAEDLISVACLPGRARITDMTIYLDISSAYLKQVIKTSPSLTHLSLSVPKVSLAVVAELLAVTHPPNTEDKPLIPFADLKSIFLHVHLVDNSNVAPVTWDTFCRSLTSRKSVGIPLHELTISFGHSISAEQKLAFQKTVAICDIYDIYGN